MTSVFVPPDYREVRAVIRWKGDRAEWQELMALRHVVQEFADLGLEAVRERVGNAAGWDLGIFPLRYAEHDLTRLVEAHGLRLELTEVCSAAPPGLE